ncbi:MAG: twitch domain-containing radical SAM protein, partial [Candidimonas sp.]
KFWTVKHSKEHMNEMLKNIVQIQFTGGEPMIEREHYDILDMAIESKRADQINLSYYSNGTFINNKLIEKWKHFKTVNVNLSIDDLYHRYEYQRYGAKWDLVWKNIRHFKSIESEFLKFNFFPTISVFNIYYMNEYYEKLKDIFYINSSLLYLPNYYSCKVLPRALKEIISDRICHILPDVVKYMNDDDWSHLLPQMKSIIKRDDVYRNQSFENVFPEISKYV